MGHYDSCYEADEEALRADRKRRIVLALRSVLDAKSHLPLPTKCHEEQRAWESLLDAEVFLRQRIVNLKE